MSPISKSLNNVPPDGCPLSRGVEPAKPAEESGAGGDALADGADVENLEDTVQVVITEDKVAGSEQARHPLLHPIGARLG